MRNVRVLVGDTGWAVLYCTITTWAFGPVFRSPERAYRFLNWAETEGYLSLKKLTEDELNTCYMRWALHDGREQHRTTQTTRTPDHDRQRTHTDKADLGD
jgi:hypothetical protein